MTCYRDVFGLCVFLFLFLLFIFSFGFHFQWEFVYFICRYRDLVYYFVPILVLVIDEYEMSYELHDLILDFWKQSSLSV
jgi:hypothetical protein